jgi:DNA-directed RNA polymerase subunit H (RpoH/RPB5)
MIYDRGFEIPEKEIPLLEKEKELTDEEFDEIYPPGDIEDLNVVYYKPAKEPEGKEEQEGKEEKEEEEEGKEEEEPEEGKEEEQEKEEIPEPEERLLVYYLFIHEERKIGTNDIQDFVKKMLSMNITNIVLITDRPLAQHPNQTIQEEIQLSHQSETKTRKLSREEKRALEEMGKLPYFIQHFQHIELMYNPTEHYTTVPHRALSDREKERFLKNARIKNPSKLPSLKVTDKIAKYYGFKLGQIIVVTRPNLGNSVVTKYNSVRFVVE